MRKKTVNHLADTIFWYALYFLPVLSYLLFCLAEPATSSTVVSFNEYITTAGFSSTGSNVIYRTIYDIFGGNGIFPLFSTIAPIHVLCWFANMMLIHLAVDFILFIPRLCHKWLKTFTQGE